MVPVGLFIMFTEFGRQFLWTTTVFLGLQAVIMFFVLSEVSGWLSAIISAISLIIASFFIEWWGVTTGFPFGNYVYTEVLQPKVFGVPLAIAFAWFSLTSSSLIISKYLVNSSAFASVLISSVLILATDILLEPFAAFVNNYWQWLLFRIPIQNYAAWLVIGFIFSFALNKLLKRNKPAKTSFIISVVITGINVLNFSIVNITKDHIVNTAIGLLIFTAVFFIVFVINKRARTA